MPQLPEGWGRKKSHLTIWKIWYFFFPNKIFYFSNGNLLTLFLIWIIFIVKSKEVTEWKRTWKFQKTHFKCCIKNYIICKKTAMQIPESQLTRSREQWIKFYWAFFPKLQIYQKKCNKITNLPVDNSFTVKEVKFDLYDQPLLFKAYFSQSNLKGEVPSVQWI